MKSKLNKPNFWLIIAAIYLIFLFAVIWFYNPDFLKLQNALLIAPLYILLGISTALQSRSVEDYDYIWITRFSWIGATALVVVFKIIVEQVR